MTTEKDITKLPDDDIAERRAEIRTEISKLKRADEALKAERDTLDQEIRRRFAERGTSGTRTKLYTLTLREDDQYPEVQDRTEFEEYLLATGKLHLLQKRLALGSMQEELALMREERLHALDSFKEIDLESPTANDKLVEFFAELDPDLNEDVFRSKLLMLRALGVLKKTLTKTIDEHFTIPGIQIVKKLTINQVKR